MRRFSRSSRVRGKNEYASFDNFITHLDVSFGKHFYEKMPGGAKFDGLLSGILVVDEDRILELSRKYIANGTKRIDNASTEFLALADKHGIKFDRGGRILLGDFDKYADIPNPLIRNAVACTLSYDESMLSKEDLAYVNHLRNEETRIAEMIDVAKSQFVKIAMHYRNYRHIHAMFPEIVRLFDESKYDTKEISEGTKARLKPRSSWILEGINVDVYCKLAAELSISKSQRS